MRKHRLAVVARAVRRASAPSVRPESAFAGSSWLLLGVVLSGLFAMHGLGTHGTPAAHGAESMSMSMPVSVASEGAGGEGAAASHSPGGPAGRDDAGMSMDAMSRAVVSPAAVTPLVDPSGAVQAAAQVVAGDSPAGLPDAGVLVLCFAVLTTLVAWMFARGSVPRVVTLVPRLAQVVTARGSGRDRDPPSLLVLSVHRC